MRKLSIWVVLICFCNNAKGQACQERFFTELEKPLIIEYLDQALKNRWFLGDIGVIAIYERDLSGQGKMWELIMLYDDAYKQSPPQKYAYIRNFLVLFFQGEKDMEESVKERRIACLDTHVLDRLYIRPLRRERLMYPRKTEFRDSEVFPEGSTERDIRNPVVIDESPATYRKIIFSDEGKAIYKGGRADIQPVGGLN